MQFSCFPVLLGSTEAQVIWGGIVKHLLIAYFIVNISAKKYQDPFTNDKPKVGTFLRHGLQDLLTHTLKKSALVSKYFAQQLEEIAPNPTETAADLRHQYLTSCVSSLIFSDLQRIGWKFQVV